MFIMAKPGQIAIVTMVLIFFYFTDTESLSSELIWYCMSCQKYVCLYYRKSNLILSYYKFVVWKYSRWWIVNTVADLPGRKKRTLLFRALFMSDALSRPGITICLKRFNHKWSALSSGMNAPKICWGPIWDPIPQTTLRHEVLDGRVVQVHPMLL